MKLMIKHELPKRLRYAKVYLEFFSASLYFSLDGARASVVGSIGGGEDSAGSRRTRSRLAISDREYSSYRASHDVLEVLDQDEDRVVLKTADGYEEEWIRPKWVLNGVRRSRQQRAVS